MIAIYQKRCFRCKGSGAVTDRRAAPGRRRRSCIRCRGNGSFRASVDLESVRLLWGAGGALLGLILGFLAGLRAFG